MTAPTFRPTRITRQASWPSPLFGDAAPTSPGATSAREMSRAHFLDSAIVWRLATGAAWLRGFQRLSHHSKYTNSSQLTANVAGQRLVWAERPASPPWYARVQCSRQRPNRHISPVNACGVAALRVPGRFGQDATTEVGAVDYHASYRSDTIVLVSDVLPCSGCYLLAFRRCPFTKAFSEP